MQEQLLNRNWTKIIIIFILINGLFTNWAFAQMNDLIPTNTATHTAVQNGNWFDGTTWNTGTVPGDAAIVVIPMGKTVTYEGQSSAHIFAIRVDGTFVCQQTNSASTTTLTFDTFVGTMMSYVKFLANNATDGKIDITIEPFDIEAHKAGTSGYTQVWNNDAKTHFSDGATMYEVTREVGPDSRFNSYADAIAGNTSVTELTRTVYDDGNGVTGRYGWDSTQLSLGIMTMGQLEIIGQEKLVMSKLANDAAKAQRDVQLENTPTGWLVGDSIIITKGGNIGVVSNGNDLKAIDILNGTTITTTTNLNKNHEGKVSGDWDLHCYAGNLTRNITFKSANPNQIHHRGHLMAMGSGTNVQIRNAAFKDMGRTDKSRLLDDFIWKQWLQPAVFNCKISALGQEVCEMERNLKGDITNSRGRYSLHLHKLGTTHTANMAYITGCVVWGNPGWGITHHDSYATISDNVVYDVTGGGIVSESGSEMGFWDDNLVVDIDKGHTYDKYASALFHDDYLFSGQGLAMKGRGVVCRNNVIVDAVEGVGIINMNPSTTNHDRVDAQALATFRPDFQIDQFPLSQNGYSSEGDGVMPVEVALILENTTTIACNQALRSIERDMGVNHESRSVFDGFICWGIDQGLSITYQADYSFKDVFISGNGTSGTRGMYLWKHSHNHVFENIRFVDLDYAVTVSKLVESGNGLLKTRNNGFTPWYFIDATTENVTDFYEIILEDPSTGTAYTEHADNPIHLAASELVNRDVSFTILDSTELYVDYGTSDFRFEVDGIITDDLGSYKMGIKQAEAQGTLRLDYPERIYEFASQAKFEQYLTANNVYKDTANNDQLYFIINEVLPNRRTWEYTSFPVRVKILNAPSNGVFSNPQIEANWNPENQIISRFATATQSSTKGNISYDGEVVDVSAWKAIDGNNNGRENCQIFQRGLVPVGSYSQTQNEVEPWYDLDFGELKIIDYIDIWNTVELNANAIETNSTHFKDFYVLISDTPFGSSNLAAARAIADYEYYVPNTSPKKRKVSFNNLNVNGQYVRVQAVGTTKIKLAEIEVIGKTYVQPIVLPAELLDFTAEAAPNDALESILKWITLSEINVSHFDIEHAIDNTNFKKIDEVQATGDSAEMENYIYNHLNPNYGKNYYRLKIVDNDGRFEYSNTEVVAFQPNTFLTIYPNPTESEFNINIASNNWAERLKIYNAIGQVIYKKDNIKGENFLTINLSQSGIFTIVILGNNGEKAVEKIVVW
ncbi:MAG: T9SS type A sorting domain-containing protein [Saprospiraceae bacterium]